MKRHPLAAFFVLTFLVSWSMWFVMLAVSQGKITVTDPNSVVSQLWKWGGFSPFFIALLVALMTGGSEGVHTLLGRFLRWRVHPIWYLAALLLPAGISLVITAIHMMVGGEAPDFSHPRIYDLKLRGFYQDYTAWTILLPLFLQNLLVGSVVDSTPIGEETGWRGFALPYLQGRYSALASSVALGLIWGLWRWPLFWAQDPGGPMSSYAWVLLGVVPGAILATWVFNNTGGSLLLVLLYNNSFKITDWFLASSFGVSPAITIFAFWLVAIAALCWGGPARLSRRALAPGCIEGPPATSVPVVQNLSPSPGLSPKP